MEDDIKIRWIEALRSGEYKQGYGALRTIDNDGAVCHCVVGVLADVIDPNGWTDVRTDTPDWTSVGAPAVYWRNNLFGLPDDIWDGFNIPFEVHDTVMHKNDEETLNFKQLADYLEDALSEGSIQG